MPHRSSRRDAFAAGRALDALNFCLADVQGGLGPYLAVYLLSVRQWNPAEIGVVLSLGGIAGILANTPAGALVDRTRGKRRLIALCALFVTFGAVALYFAWGFWSVALVQLLVGSCGAVFGPAIAAVSLGIVGHHRFASRNGRNQAFNHVGNAAAAAAVGGCAYVWGPVAAFAVIAVLGLASIASVLAVPPRAIDHERARGLRAGEAGPDGQPAGFWVLAENRPLMVFAVCVVLFHLANAAMLPLVGQELALRDRNQGTALMSACILGAQLVMVPMALLAGRKAESWGRKGLFLAAFAILPIRGCLYTLSGDPYWLLGVQLLDGVGAGLFGALAPLIVADLTQGSGRFNVSLGAIATGQGIGAALSAALAGAIVAAVGFTAAYLTLAAFAAAGFLLFWLAMPETLGIVAAVPLLRGPRENLAPPVGAE